LFFTSLKAFKVGSVHPLYSYWFEGFMLLALSQKSFHKPLVENQLISKSRWNLYVGGIPTPAAVRKLFIWLLAAFGNPFCGNTNSFQDDLYN
jgi:hypothetical protein